LPLAGYLSYVLRLEGFDWATYGVGFLLLVGLACVIVPSVFRWAGVYSRYWRYASVDEMLLLAGAVTTAVVLVGAISLAVVQFLPSAAAPSAPAAFDSPHLPAAGAGCHGRPAFRLAPIGMRASAQAIQRQEQRRTAPGEGVTG